MGHLSFQAAHGIVWPTYVVLLITASIVAYWKRDSKTFLSANGTQKGVPLAFNFVASALGCGVLSAYPQIANIDGLQGLLVYALAGGLPMFLFAFFGPQLKKRAPEGFVLTEWVFQRYGKVCGLYLSACTILTVYLFMVSEIASLKYAIETLTNIKALPVVIVECIVTTIYTSIGGFHISFLTDTLQVGIVFVLLIVVACAMGRYVEIDRSKIGPSGLLKGNKLGWQLVYILVVAIFTNDFFMSGFWLRTFAARSNKDLIMGCSIAFFVLTAFVTVVGVTGFIAVWAGLVEVADQENSGACFFILLAQLPSWVMGFTLVFVAVLSTCTLDSLQSALVSTISNDVFRNKLPIIYVRSIVVAIMVPVVVVGLIAEDVLTIYLIVDLLSSTVVPILMLGLSSKFFFLTAWEVIGGGLGGILAVWIFGTVYYNSPKEGGRLLLIWNGLYVNDWSTFGAFVVAPFGGVLAGFLVLAARSAIRYVYCKHKGIEFDVFTKKPTLPAEGSHLLEVDSSKKGQYTSESLEVNDSA
ncbi:LAMI_0H11782g1_1 [Lachancea mirantina]|uniref:LAMI_0H11782g1_1 n=1 Tax=Lachancea mirantina TaxID=1230905 RepID=A0A1G4KH60_9SACH|nr:LAMI_0H11782g1_1 [Lachancea mirantina]